MRLNFRLASIVSGMAIGLGMAILIAPQDHLTAQQTSSTKPKLKIRRQPSAPPSRGFPNARDAATPPAPPSLQGFPAMRVNLPPPPSRGFPGVPDAAISRGDCPSAGAKLVALAPKFVQKGLNSGDSDELSVWGQTKIGYPTLWFVVPFTDRSTQLEFVLQDREDEEIYRTVIPAPRQAGVMGVKIKSPKPLELDRPYRWTLKAKFTCGESAPEQRYVDGWIQRVALPVGVDVVSNPTQVYVDRGIWYDAVTSLAERRLLEPRNVQLGQDWRELLGVVNLVEFVGQPVLK